MNPGELQRLTTLAVNEPTSAKGKLYENAARYLFECVPGTMVEPNVSNPLQTEQIDLAVGNLQYPDGLPLLPSVFIVECKLLSKSVSSDAFGYFINTLRNRRMELGVLISASGLAGDELHQTNAHALGISALRDGIKVVVMNHADLLGFTSTSDVINTLQRRYLRAFASGGIGGP